MTIIDLATRITAIETSEAECSKSFTMANCRRTVSFVLSQSRSLKRRAYTLWCVSSFPPISVNYEYVTLLFHSRIKASKFAVWNEVIVILHGLNSCCIGRSAGALPWLVLLCLLLAYCSLCMQCNEMHMCYPCVDVKFCRYLHVLNRKTIWNSLICLLYLVTLSDHLCFYYNGYWVFTTNSGGLLVWVILWGVWCMHT